MITMYRTNIVDPGTIDVVQVVRSTEYDVVMPPEPPLYDAEQTWPRIARGHPLDYPFCFFDTWSEAKAHLLHEAEGACRFAMEDFKRAFSRYTGIIDMEEPTS